MKRIYYYMMIILSSAVQYVYAQETRSITMDDIFWSDYSKKVEDVLTEEDTDGKRKYIFLFNRSAVREHGTGPSDAFVANGGRYGMQGVLSNIGNRYYITRNIDEKGNNVYLIHSRTTNTVETSLGNCMVIKDKEDAIFMDCANKRIAEGDQAGAPNWEFIIDKEADQKPDGTQKVCYFLKNVDYNNAYLIYDYDNERVHYTYEDSKKEKWCLILEEDYMKVISELTQDKYVEATGLLYDGGFNRFNDYENRWNVVYNDGNDAEIWDVDAIDINKKYIAGLETKIAENQSLLSEKQAELEEKKDLLTSDEIIKELQTEIENLQTEINNLQAQINSVTNSDDYKEKSTEIDKTQVEIDNLQIEIDEINKYRDDFVKRKIELSNEINKLTDDIENNSYSEDELAEKKALLAELQKEYDSMNNGELLDEFNTSGTTLTSKIEEKNKKEKELVELKSQLEDLYGTLRTEKSEKEKELTELTNKKSELENGMADIKSAIEELDKEIKVIEENNVLYDNKIKLLSYKSHVIGGVETEKAVRAANASWWDKSVWEFWGNYGNDFCAGIYGNGQYRQEITGLPAGIYRVTCTGVNMSQNENYGSFVVNGQKVPMPVITDEQKSVLKGYKDEIVSLAKTNLWLEDDYYYQGLDIISASKLLNDNNINNDLKIDYYVEITDADVKAGTNSITFGFSKNDNNSSMPVFADNFRLFYTNMSYVAYISANNTEEVEIDKYAYNKPVDLYVRRSFTNDAWNAIVLPYNITVGGLSEFGNGVKLSKLVGINPERPTQIKFVNTNELKAGECGLIYVPEDSKPLLELSEATKTLAVLGSPVTVDGTFTRKEKTIHGPLYVIHGVSRPSVKETYDGKVEFENIVNDIYSTDAGSLKFTGYYYKTNTKWEEHSYIMDDGRMYYLTNDWGTVYGTMWSLEDVENYNAQSARMVFEINGVVDNETTSIGGVMTDNGDNMVTGKIYNVNGQYMGDNTQTTNLPKGLYIANGKKFVVK